MAKSYKSPSGFTVLVGRNARENDVIVSYADVNDLWFHSAEVPGAHVVLCCGKKDVVHDDIVFCAKLTGSKSVMYCYIGDITKPKRSCKGTVITSNEKFINL